MKSNDSLSFSTFKIKQFCEDRDWDQFHNPKDLAIGISTEANELLDIFRFKSDDQMAAIMKDPEKRSEIGQELADVLFFLIRFAQKNDFDLLEELDKKIKINDQKYPVEQAKGKNLKYNELE